MAGKKKETSEYDSERETRVLLENMNKNIGLIAGQHGEIKADIGEIKSRLGNVASELGTVKMVVIENSRQVKQIDAKVDNLDTRLGRVEKKLDTALDNHEQRITKIEEKVAI